MAQVDKTIDQKLKPLTFEELDLVSDFMARYPDENCDFNITILFSWGMYYQIEYAIHCDRLILFNPKYAFLLFPVGEWLTAEELHTLNNCCKKINKKADILVVPEEYVQNTPNLSEYFTIETNEDWNDYVYLTENLVNLSGKKLAKKKNLIAQFKTNYPKYRLEKIEPKDTQEIMEFSLFWKSTHDSDDSNLEAEFEAMKYVLNNWEKLPCQGIKLYVEDKLVAFSVFSPQTTEMATVHFEKYDMSIKGAGQMINYETAKYLLPDFKYINREQDMGHEGIRQAKRSYQPLRQVPAYRLKSK
ncbi:MAG: phosphatidylglycerol lysyltransferase domain-containing protein [Candidatus Cloacimonetes bacterium]|nr:phosphatidylglycerol lysyltransferase domain-containing protein [Candidatus Cloacimonadota bacterium]